MFIFIYFLFFYTINAQSIQDVQRLRNEYEKFIEQQKKLPIEDLNNTNLELRPSRIDILPNLVENKYENDEELKYFGYDYFTIKDTVSFWENLPLPSSYVLGPGDEIIVSLWGQTQLRENYRISRSGKIFDERVGLLNLSGLDINQAKEYLKSQFGNVYATLKGKNPSTYMDLSFGDLQSINVNFVGFVKKPGIYPLHPFSSLLTGLIQAGGIDTSGSLRSVKIKRNTNEEYEFDLYDYLINGNKSDKLQLRNQDVIIVPPRNSQITVDSAVVRPGIYEALSGETVYDLISYAGGPTHNASEIFGIRRLNNKSLNDSSKNLHKSFYSNLEMAKIIPVLNGDHINLRNIFPQILEVEIIGQVKSPGKYIYQDSMRLSRLLELSSGFEDSTFLKTVYVNKAEVVRRMPDSPYENVISFDLLDILEQKRDIYLQNLDRVVIHANYNYFQKKNIFIVGEVKVPGSYPIIKDNETLLSILNRAGGFTSKALEGGIAIYRDKKFFETYLENIPNDEIELASNNENEKVRVAWKKMNVILMPGDSIVVKESPGTVNVTGQVYNPGLIEFKDGDRLQYYIDAAGGLTNRANKEGIIVLYPNGVVEPYRWYKSPKIFDGTTIIVNEKKESEPFNATQFATNWASIISSMVTAIVLSRQL